jgi:adenylate cyclase
MRLETYLAQDRCRSLAAGHLLPARTHGTALFADISGFTPLTELLRTRFGSRRGAEMLTNQLNAVYSALIMEVERYGGSVISFAGDGLICWFDDSDGPAALKAVGCGLALQEAIRPFHTLPLSDKTTTHLALKVALATGPVRRFVVGDPDYQYLDTLAGTTITRLAAAERLAQKREVVVDEATAQALAGKLTLQTWRTDPQTAVRFGIVQQLNVTTNLPTPPPPVALASDLVKPWLNQSVYERELAGQAALLAEFRPCAALFVLFAGIDYEADTAEKQLDIITRQMQVVAADYEGVLLQLTIGDKGSYAYLNFGALHVHEDDPRRGLKAAIALQEAAHRLDWLTSLQIGISYGLMWVGTHGGATRRTYTALGDDVNMAARLMETAVSNQILVTQQIETAVAHQYRLEPLPLVPIKGKSDPQHLFSLIGPRPRQALRLQEPAYTLPMVGRQAELQLAKEKLILTQQGQVQIVGIVAEAGMGKSRLVVELMAAARQHGFTVLGGACQSDGVHTPYLVWRAIWSAFFALDFSKPLPDQIDSLAQTIQRLARQRRSALPLLGKLLHLAIPDNEFTQALEPEVRQSALHALLEDCLKAATQTEPILIVIEDAHWIDALAHELLDELARSLLLHPVCFVLAYRPPQIERLQTPRVEALPNFTPIRLGQLNDPEAEQLIHTKLAQLYPQHSDSVPTELVEKLIARTQGSPFYLEELLNFLRDQNIDPSQPAVLETVDLPDSLHTLVLSRIDRLTTHQKMTLRLASIIGRRFQALWLSGYYPKLGKLSQVKTALDQLDSLEITLLDSPEPELSYLFKHIITHEVAYQSLPFATRARLHEQLADYLETTYADMPPVELLAFHYRQSHNVPKQRYYLRQAGEIAQHNFANDAALTYYGWLLPLLVDPSEKVEIHLKRGAVLELTGNWDAAETDYQSALTLAQRPSDKADAKFSLGKLQRIRGDYDMAISWLAEAQTEYQDTNNQTGVVQSYIEIGSTFSRQGELVRAQETFYQGLTLAHQAEDKKGIARLLNLLGNTASDQGEYSRAQTLYEESLAMKHLLNDKPGISAVLNNLGLIAWAQSDYTTAQTLFEQSLLLKREMGFKQGVANLLGNLGLVANDQDDYATARTLLAESLTLRREMEDKWGLAIALSGLGSVTFNQGDYETAQSLLAESLTLSAELDDALGVAYNLAGLAEVAMMLTHMGRAATLVAAVEQILVDIKAALEPAYRTRLDKIVATVQTEPSFQPAWAAGAQMTLAEAVAYGLAVG